MYKFIKIRDATNEFDRTDVIVRVHDNDMVLADLLEKITSFLKACGYSLDGLDVVFNNKQEDT